MNIFLVIAFFLLMAIVAIFAWRNEKVFNERMRVIGKIFMLNLRDQTMSQWRWDEYEKIAYNQMVYQFWKPISSFYENNPALDDRITSAGRN